MSSSKRLLATLGIPDDALKPPCCISRAHRALSLVGALQDLDGAAVVDFVFSCQHECGGFGGNVGHDPHLLYTLSAVQILCLFDALERLDVPRVMRYVSSLQRPDGSFQGDEWGEIDTRFSYCALCCASLLGELGALDVPGAVAFVQRCENFDGGYGCMPGGESHAGQVFTCVGALAIAGALDACQRDLLSWWLCERQTPGGGLNGRPQKEADVCYSWWVSWAEAFNETFNPSRPVLTRPIPP